MAAPPIALPITDIRWWAPHLLSFRTPRPDGFRFEAGQFVRLGLNDIFRAYSIVSGPYDPYLEYYSIVVPDGAFTQALARCRVGDTVWMEPQAHGFLTLSRFPLEGDLWMLASGTGLAPFLSILAEPEAWTSFDRLILVHSVRTAGELAYTDWLQELAHHEVFGEFAHKLQVVPVVTRGETLADAPRPVLRQRIPKLLQGGELEAATGLSLTLDRSKIMICGNPDMVSDTRNALKERGFVSARQSRPGQIATENYW